MVKSDLIINSNYAKEKIRCIFLMESIMKNSLKIYFLLAGILLFQSFGNLLFAAEKTLQINIDGCLTWAGRGRIGSILRNTNGIIKFDYNDETYTIEFDDQKTNANSIIGALGKEGFKIKGEPVYK